MGLTDIRRRVEAFPPAVFQGVSRGIEKEGLRVRPDGQLAATPHPAGLGSALTHPHITTDFSESQLELITGVHASVDGLLAELEQLHQVVYRNLGDELVWCASMPCRLPPDDRIPIADYGRSNVGRMKAVYRRGLSHRYGRRMQVISGIHYNFSLADEAWALLQPRDSVVAPDIYRDQRYLALIRNFRRHAWMLFLLLGSAPAAGASFVAGRNHRLCTWEEGDTVFAPGATSLRMGTLGYQSEAQSSIAVSFNDLRGYADPLYRAMTEPYPPYEAIGLRDGEGYRQLSTALLQIENEFYGKIRPKRVTRSGERPLHALGKRGIEYVEVRCLDVDPFVPLGIDAAAIHLLDVFLFHCVIADSPRDSPEEIAAISCNQKRIAEGGRDPLIRLDRGGAPIAPVDWCLEVLGECEPIATALDAAHGGKRHREALAAAQRTLRDLSSLPSSRVLRTIEERHGKSFREFALAQSRRHRDEISAARLSPEAETRYAQLAARSLAEQERIESADDVPFETYRRRYLDQDLLSGTHLRRGEANRADQV